MEDRVSGPFGLRVPLGCSGHQVTGSRGSGLRVFVVQWVFAENPLELPEIKPDFTTKRAGHTGSQVRLTGRGSKLLGSAKNRVLSSTRVDPAGESAGTRVTDVDPWRIGLHLPQLSRSHSQSLNSLGLISLSRSHSLLSTLSLISLSISRSHDSLVSLSVFG
jgi:hypothetical protein